MKHTSVAESTGTKGFTLLEILIAMFILAVVLSTIFSSYTGTFRVIDETESQAEVYAMARIVMERVKEDLESAFISKREKDEESEEDALQPTRFVGETKEIKGRDADTLRFLSRAHLVFDEDTENSGLAEIIYFVNEKDEENGFAIYRSDTPELEDAVGKETGGLMLCDDLFSVDISYYDADGEKYDSWDSSKREFEERLPTIVSISLKFLNKKSDEGNLKFMTKIALPMARNEYDKPS